MATCTPATCYTRWTPTSWLFWTVIVVELSQRDRKKFCDVMAAITYGDPDEAGRMIIDRSPRPAHVRDPEVFATQVGALIRETRNTGMRLGQVKMGDVLQRLLTLSCKHRAVLRSRFRQRFHVNFGDGGVGEQLDPNTDMFKVALPYIVKTQLGFSGMARKSHG